MLTLVKLLKLNQDQIKRKLSNTLMEQLKLFSLMEQEKLYGEYVARQLQLNIDEASIIEMVNGATHCYLSRECLHIMLFGVLDHYIQKQLEPTSEESKEFHTPEYLDYQSRCLQVDISNIEKELKPLKLQYEKLKKQEDSFVPNSPKSPKSP